MIITFSLGLGDATKAWPGDATKAWPHILVYCHAVACGNVALHSCCPGHNTVSDIPELQGFPQKHGVKSKDSLLTSADTFLGAVVSCHAAD